MDGPVQDGRSRNAPKVELRLCPLCAGEMMVPYVGMCPWHALCEDSSWSMSNRAWCDFFHRKVEPEFAPI
jgi:hypothetical protein